MYRFWGLSQLRDGFPRKTAVFLDFVQITSPLSSSRMKIEYMMMQVKRAQTMMVRWAVYLVGILFAQPDLPN